MSAKARNLTKLLSDSTAKKLTRSAITTTTSAAQDLTLKQYIQLANAADSSSSSPLKPSQSKKSSSSRPLSELAAESVRVDTFASLYDSKWEFHKNLNSILCGSTGGSSDSEESYDERPSDDFLEIPWSPVVHSRISLRRKDVSRDRKHKWVFKSTQGNRFERLVRMCTNKLGAGTAIEVLCKLGRETGVKEFNAMIHLCIKKARNTDDEDVALEEFHRAYLVFESMRERGFQIEEETYGPFLMFITDMGMVEEFHFFCNNIKKGNLDCLSRLAYYEMRLCIKVVNEDMIRMLIANTDCSGGSDFIESYLMALCEGGRQEEVSMLLEKVDIKKISSLDNKKRIFKSLGWLLLESHAKKFILELKNDDEGEQDLLNLIYCYTISMPNILIEDIVVKFKNLQAELKVASSPVPYEKLIKACCESLEVHLAIDLVDWMLGEGLPVEITTFHSIFTACYSSCEYNLVHRIYSMINHHNIKPNAETFKCMISLCVKMKDFDGAYGMIEDLRRLNLIPTSNMYNAIMGGYFREKNFQKGLMVLKQMDASNVKPDCQTFSYIIGNCRSEADIIKYHKELKESGVQLTKHVFMSLINAYAACGLFEKAKKVVSEKDVPINKMSEIKSVLVAALTTHGQVADALEIYDEITQIEEKLEPKAILCLIEHIQSEGELSLLLELLNQIDDLEFWNDGCARIILYCVRHKMLSPAVDLLKQRLEKMRTNEIATEVIFDEVFCLIAETEPTDVQFGLDLLKAIKEDIGIRPSRRSLDFVLGACVKAKDLQRSFSVWKEYQMAGLPYNVVTSVRMYQALLASGAHKAAKILLESIPDDDPHVCRVVNACQRTFRNSVAVENKEKAKKKKKKKKK